MVPTRLAGRSGWWTVVTLSMVLTGLVGLQLRPTTAHADPVVPVTLAADVGAPDTPAPDPSPSPDPSAELVAPPAAAPAPARPDAVAAAPAPAPAPVPKPARTTVPKPAEPVLLSDVCGGDDWQHRRGLRALATLRHPTPSGVTVAFRPGTPGFLGLTYPQRHHVDLFVRSCGAESWTLLRHVAAHEMGHAYDAAHMTTASRAAYEAIRGIPADTPWFGCSYCTDFATPAGDFAETYAQWQRDSSDSRTRIAVVPGPAALARIGAAFFSD